MQMKLTLIVTIIFLACLALTSNPRVIGDETAVATNDGLTQLLVEREKMAAQFGVKHPSVRDLDIEIALTRRFLRQPDSFKELLPLRVKREKAAAQFGERHPTVLQFDKEIEVQRQLLSLNDDGTNIRPEEAVGVVAIIKDLAKRVHVLEREVAALKARNR
jgi:hypothetical protein